MDLGLRGRSALVCGASSGIGEAIALAFAAEGVSLTLAARDVARLEKVAERSRSAGAPSARALRLDLTAPQSVRDLLGAITTPIDILILNGGGPKPGTFTQTPLDDWDSAYHLLLRGAVELVNGLLPAMRANGWGRILALTSTAVKQPIDALVLSDAYRTALVATLKTLAAEVARDGVTVNSIATGRVETARMRQLYTDEARLRAAAEEVPIGRIASPAEFAPMAVFLCSEPACYVTGQTISVDGGLTRGLFG